MIDTISRQAAIERIEKQKYREPSIEVWKQNDRVALACYDTVIETLKRLPCAEPKHGKWILQRNYTWACSECGTNPTEGMGYVQRKEELFEFCPHCSADMRESE